MPAASALVRLKSLPDNAKGGMILLCAAFFFTLMSLLVKLLGSNFHVVQILFIRQIVMSAIVAPLILRGFPHTLATARPGLQIGRIIVAMVAMLLGFTAIIRLPLADATAIAFAKSFFVTIFAIVILHETVGSRRWLAVAAGFLGVMVMLRPGTNGFSIYGLYAVIGAASAGLVMVFIRMLSRTERPTTILAWQAIGLGIIMAAPAAYFWKWPTPGEWLLLAALGVVSYSTQMLNIMAYKFGEASVMASLDYVRLLYAAILGFLVFGDLPMLNTWIGAAIIVLASIYTIRREARRRQTIVSRPEGRAYD